MNEWLKEIQSIEGCSMTLGDGVRRNIVTVSVDEQNQFRDAIITLNEKFFPGFPTEFPAGGVSYWFKQDEIHQATHVHGEAAFLPWHRELCNRFEEMLREVNQDLSLHYWDWNTDPSPLFTESFMGNANGDVGEPWLSAGFYDPFVLGEDYRDDIVHALLKDGYDAQSNPADPPKTLSRKKWAGDPPVGQTFGLGTESQKTWWSDDQLMSSASFGGFNLAMSDAHGLAHEYIGGNLMDPHMSFRDPFVFLLHSNVDRLWAM